SSGCHPFTTSLTNQSVGAQSIHWSYGDGQTSDTTAAVHAHAWHNYAGPGAHTFPLSLTVTSGHGCTNTATSSVQVYPQVVAAFVADSAGCSPMNPHFVNLSTGASSYLWTFGDGGGSVAIGPAHVYNHQGLA